MSRVNNFSKEFVFAWRLNLFLDDRLVSGGIEGRINTTQTSHETDVPFSLTHKRFYVGEGLVTIEDFNQLIAETFSLQRTFTFILKVWLFPKSINAPSQHLMKITSHAFNEN